MSAKTTSTPTIQFSTSDGAAYEFNEDYIILCGSRRSFCLIRDFAPGEHVDVVYKPHMPGRAYVHDWALFATAMTWFIELAISLVLILMIAGLIANRPLRFSIQLGNRIDS